jgi:hypothetical protein
MVSRDPDGGGYIHVRVERPAQTLPGRLRDAKMANSASVNSMFMVSSYGVSRET